MKYTLLSKKEDQITLLVNKNQILKIVNRTLFMRLFFLKNNLTGVNVLHFDRYKKKSENKFILYYTFYSNNFSQIYTYQENPIKYIHYIFEGLENLNKKTLINKNGILYGYIHIDPQFRNHIIKNGNIYFIDLESLSFSPIIFQPFYLFSVITLDKKYFSQDITLKKIINEIFTIFLSTSIYRLSFKRIGTKRCLDLFLDVIKNNKEKSYKNTRDFIQTNFNFIIKSIEENYE